MAVSHLHKTTKGQIVVSNDTLDLVEFSQVRSIDGLVTEHTINGEVTGWWWAAIGALLLCQFVQHVGTDGGGVRSKDELLRLLSGPWIPVAYRAIFSFLYVQLALVWCRHLLYTYLVHILDVIPVGLVVTFVARIFCSWHVSLFGI